MKIMHILPELEEGGVERLIPVFSNGQSALGHEVSVVSYGGRLTSLLNPGVRHIRMAVHKKNPITIIACALHIARVVREEKIQIVHAHSRVPGWVCYFVRKFAPGVKFVYTAHARFSSMNFASVWPVSQADGVTCVSNCVKDHFKEWLPEENPVRVIYNARPGKMVPWEGSGDPENKHLLFVGRISEKKGPDTLVQALSMIKNDNWHLDVLGDGPLMPKLKNQIKELKLEDKITLHGYSNKVPEMISRCDLFLFPSMDEEGLPLALTEVLYAGAPVIASDIAASRELAALEQTETGELLAPTDVAAWADAIAHFLNGTLTPKLKLAVHLPTESEMVGAMLDFYSEVISR